MVTISVITNVDIKYMDIYQNTANYDIHGNAIANQRTDFNALTFIDKLSTIFSFSFSMFSHT